MGGRVIIVVLALVVGVAAIYFSIQTLTDAPTLTPPEESGSPTLGRGQLAAVRMSGIEYVPSKVSIRSGQTVRWTNDDKTEHTVTKISGPGPEFDSGTLAPGDTFEQTGFESKGLIEYVCEIHPEDMSGRISVVGG